MSTATIWAPRLTRGVAIARPMPLAAPVTTAILSPRVYILAAPEDWWVAMELGAVLRCRLVQRVGVVGSSWRRSRRPHRAAGATGAQGSGRSRPSARG